MFPVLASENAVIIVENGFTLDSNERYRAEIFSKSYNGNFNISGAVNFSEWLDHSIHVL